MRDSIGNVISENDLLKIEPGILERLVFQVAKIDLSSTPPILVLVVSLPIVDTGNPEPVLHGILAVRNPASERLIHTLADMGGGRRM